MQQSQKKWTIIGGGNGGQAFAGHLGMQGIDVTLYDILPSLVEAIQFQKGVKVSGELEGFGEVKATTSLASALEGADIIMVVTPAFAHSTIAEQAAPFLKDGQVIVLNPGSTGGVLEFKQKLSEVGCSVDVILAETMSLLYACRSLEPGHVEVFGIKRDLPIAALPAQKTKEVLDLLNPYLCNFVPAKNILETSLENLNAVVHPLPSLLNAARIDSHASFLYYHEGISEKVGDLVEQLDRERMSIGEALGVPLHSAKDWLNRFYGVRGNTFYEAVQQNKSYSTIVGPASLKNRYFLEDIPMGLIPIAAFADKCDVQVPIIQSVIALASSLVPDMHSGRNLTKLGLEGMNKHEILNYVGMYNEKGLKEVQG
ncbi:NAD/NADP octopine/nopaline dehydrogenase family protein [Pontibacillus salicampi]|uniref:NAD/NADP octopine/nopaline dehydrogenase family protein n=1 Tax=Pontibacillus salicampi TaxID=1449801 RepID=A0ABV6LQK5_9BACI